MAVATAPSLMTIRRGRISSIALQTSSSSNSGEIEQQTQELGWPGVAEMTAPVTSGYGQTVSSDDTAGHDPPLSTGAIIAIVCAVLIGVLLLAALAWYFLFFRKRKVARERDLRARASQDPVIRVIVSDGPEPASGAVSGRDAPGPRSSGGITGRDTSGSSSGAVSRRDARGPRSSGGVTGNDAPGSSSGAVSGSDAGCRMCRAGYGGERPVVLDCGHFFHRRCIRRWLLNNLTCPICNATHIALTGTGSRDATETPFQPRLSMDCPATTDDIVETRQSRSSRF